MNHRKGIIDHKIISNTFYQCIVNADLPQGSLNGPNYFIYINDLPNNIFKSFANIYGYIRAQR